MIQDFCLDSEELLARFKALLTRKAELEKLPLAPKGVWISEYTITRHYKNISVDYTYAKWEADTPIFKRTGSKKQRLKTDPDKDQEWTNHQHIGRVWSSNGLGSTPEAEEAYEELNNRRELEDIEEILKELDKWLQSFEKRYEKRRDN